MFNAVSMKGRTFWYNFGWSEWGAYVDGWIPRLSLTVPIVGYLILFNDTIGRTLEFVHITNEHINAFGLTGAQRLRFIYFGLIALGISNFLFRVKKPSAFKFGRNVTDYTKTCIDVFTLQDFMSLHDQIRLTGHQTPDGNYYDSQWEGFVETAMNTGEGTNQVERDGSWDDARSRYGSLLRSILRETFFRQDTESRAFLAICVILSTVGYVLLVVPSVDLFVKVVRSSWPF